MAFPLVCGTLWLEMANGAFHTALSTKVTMWCGFHFHKLLTSKQSAFGDHWNTMPK